MFHKNSTYPTFYSVHTRIFCFSFAMPSGSGSSGLLNFGTDSISPSSLPAQILDLQAQVKLLQLCITGNGVQIGSKVFQSFDDVCTWVPTGILAKRYGLFVDGVVLLDFFSCIGHGEAEKTFFAFFSQQKSGFVSMYEARVAASIQNLFPKVFGRSAASGLDDSDSLPAISDPDKWDNGTTSLKCQITRGMGYVEYKLESAIDSVLQDYDEARHIARGLWRLL
jgi:hypothetical protein